jgi:SEC-C motif-containing protein
LTTAGAVAKICYPAKEDVPTMVHCPCGSTKSLEECCGPLLAGERSAASAEELMRSRYSAYARGDIAYILETIHPEERKNHEESSIRQWSEESEWLGLEVLDAPADDGAESTVEFVARYKSAAGEIVAHHERSHFVRIDGRWYFQDGVPVDAAPFVRQAAKVGRNDACPCGSGRKFKKCCGVAS